ncbi:MAG: hypothetical protein DMG17_30200 [Acidobacteria bacterium]|nr:MAG: hypothetical protein DMG17_30200 [Acidobacteriota bacterium]
MSVVISLLVFAGFARTYYLKIYTSGSPLSPLVHLHGILFTSWILLFVLQTMLVAGHRVNTHRRLGLALLPLAAAMIVVGVLTSITGLRLGHNAVGAPDPVAFLAVPLGEMVIFPILIAFGVYYRQRKEAHKRLMLLATLSLLTAPLGRLPIVGGLPLAVALVYAALVLAGLIYDRIAYGRFNRVYLAGAMALWVSVPVRLAIGATQVWHDFAAWLIS